MIFGTYIPGGIIRNFSEQGHFSNTYLAKDLNLNKEVAVKDINPDKVNEDKFQNFIKELRLLTAIEHTRICPVLYAGQDISDHNKYRIVTQYYPNGSLQQKIDDATQKHCTLSLSYCVEILIYICGALSNLHSAQIIHNDIKPSNILLDQNLLPILTDFGQSTTLESLFVQTPTTYWKNISPEQFTHSATSCYSDIYQFGVLAYRLLNAYSFDQQANNLITDESCQTSQFSKAVINGDFPDRKNFPVFIPEKLVKIIKKCLNTDLNKRYQCTYDIQKDLEKVLVSDVIYNFKSRTLSGTHKKNPFQIYIDFDNSRYNVIVKKNDRFQNKFHLTGATLLQARRQISKVLKEYSRR